MTTEQSAYSWDTVDVDETITTADQAASNDIDLQNPVGRFLVTVIETTPIEKTFKAYSCMAAKLKMRIDDVIKIEQPILDGKGRLIKREGQVVQKIQDVLANKKTEINALYAGRFIFDEINLFHPKEKDAMKKRRLFVAKRLGLITPQSTILTTAMWAGAAGHQVILTTEWNSWKDKDTGEVKKNVRVGWSGYDFPANAVAGTSHGHGVMTNTNIDDFSNI